MEQHRVAVYLDFENLAISAETVQSGQALQIESIISHAASKGHISIRQAYADWSKELFAQYQSTLIELGFELIHLPGSHMQGKNGADVRLAIDVMEHLESYPDINTIVIGSGDSDFIPLIQRLQARNKQVIIIGFEHSVAQLIKKNSSEFRSIESLSLQTDQVNGHANSSRYSLDYGKELLEKTIKLRKLQNPILMARLKQQMLKVDPEFSEKQMGFSSFKQFLQALKGDLINQIDTQEDTLPQVYLYMEDEKGSENLEQAENFLYKKIRYRTDTEQRLFMAESLLDKMKDQYAMSMDQMFDYVYETLDGSLSKADIRKYINTLFTGGAFKFDEDRKEEPLLLRPLRLREDIDHPEELDQIYIRRIIEILQRRYQNLSDTDILELLF